MHWLQKFTSILVPVFIISLNFLPGNGETLSKTKSITQTSTTSNNLITTEKRRVNIPYFENSVIWAKSAIFWFGTNEQGLPGKNYVDVRMAYTLTGLEIRVTVVDYYLWYNTNPQTSDDLSEFDAIAVFFDTSFDQANVPQPDDFIFLSGASQNPNETNLDYQRDSRGNGIGWDQSWYGDWLNTSFFQWSDYGPNNNDGNIDYGWVTHYTIPWDAFDLSSPPSEGTIWGLSLQLHDRDDNPPAGFVQPQAWPETSISNSPATWGEIHFGNPRYTPETTTISGHTMIRAESPIDNTVEDAWMGGGGWCIGGHEGGSELNYGDHPNLFSGSEIIPTHFPCFNKSYIRFQLDEIPPGVEIISATLTLHLWGNADQSIAPPYSWIHLFEIKDYWEEMSIHWNNAPLAAENISAIQVYPYSQPGAIDWPGDPYIWDATIAVAQAYKGNQPVNLAIYSSDTGRDTSKYFSSSETGDWNADARPTLHVYWGSSEDNINKTASQSIGRINDTIDFQLSWQGTGQPQTVIDQMPLGLSTPTNMDVNFGEVIFDESRDEIQWTGTPNQGFTVLLNYQSIVQIDGPQILINTANLSDSTGFLSEDDFHLFIDPIQVFIPILKK